VSNVASLLRENQRVLGAVMCVRALALLVVCAAGHPAVKGGLSTEARRGRPVALRAEGVRALPRKRFAWELDAEALANDYAWEGAPAWGWPEELRRWSREETRRREVEAADGEEAAAACAPGAGPTAEACGGRGGQWLAGLGGVLEGIGGGQHALHDPDQFSLWRKGWMASATSPTAEVADTISDKPMGPSHEDASSEWSGDAVEPRGPVPVPAPRGGHTGLPAGDRIVLLLLLLGQCAAPKQLGLLGLGCREVILAFPSQCHASALLCVQLLPEHNSLEATCRETAAGVCSRYARAPRPVSYRGLRRRRTIATQARLSPAAVVALTGSARHCQPFIMSQVRLFLTRGSGARKT
jgi:hypothetical protein